MKLRLHISPCPNDTFMFHALITERVVVPGVEFDVHMADIEELNRSVGGADVSKVSYAVLPGISRDFVLLDSGSALGRGNGPLLVARKGFSGQGVVAVPGIHTTANLLMTRLFPQISEKRAMLFSDIAKAVADGHVDAGVLIHEGRFTYEKCGLELVADLGVEWERTTGGLPLPLGAIVASRKLAPEVIAAVEDGIRQSVAFAMADPGASREFVRRHAQEMAPEVIERHISLFVNENSLALSPEAHRAINELTGVS